MTRTIRNTFLVCALVGASALVPVSLFAATTVTNSVNTSASSGGNSAGEGEVVEGKSSSSVKVKTVINGETVEDYEETDEGEGDTQVEYSKVINVENDEIVVTNDTSAEASTQIPQTNTDVALDVHATSSASSSQAAVGEVSLPTLDDASSSGGVRAFIAKLFGYIFSIF
jgi:hypothetical protein